MLFIFCLVHSLEEEQQTHPPVTRKIAGAAPVRTARSNSSKEERDTYNIKMQVQVLLGGDMNQLPRQQQAKGLVMPLFHKAAGMEASRKCVHIPRQLSWQSSGIILRGPQVRVLPEGPLRGREVGHLAVLISRKTHSSGSNPAPVPSSNGRLSRQGTYSNSFCFMKISSVGGALGRQPKSHRFESDISRNIRCLVT